MKHIGPTRVVYILYQQVAGVIGAFSLSALLSHFVTIDWRGILHVLATAWDAYVRPTVSFVLNNTVVALLEVIFRVHLKIPLIVRDYLSVGFVLVISSLRAMWIWQNQTTEPEASPKKKRGERLRDLAVTVGIFVAMIPVWPYLFYQLIQAARVRWGYVDPDQQRMFGLLGLLPLFYLALLLAANWAMTFFAR